MQVTTFRPQLNEKNRSVLFVVPTACDSFGQQHHMENRHWSFSEMSEISYPESLGSMVCGWSPAGVNTSYNGNNNVRI